MAKNLEFLLLNFWQMNLFKKKLSINSKVWKDYC